MTNDLGAPDAVVAALGKFVPAPSLISASTDHLRQVLRDYLIAHFAVARTFMPSLQVWHGAYVFINGSLAFEPWKRSGAGFVSIATAAQHMLFRALAQEVEGSRVRVVELVTHAFIRDRQTQPSSSIPGEAVGTFTAYLVSERAREMHAHSVQLRSIQQSKDVGLELGDEACC
jgi:NAD(P)-dependent dehydrogenase (short-subunit alcohol dehydrogenase family)